MFTIAVLGTLSFWIILVEAIILFMAVILEGEKKHYFTSISFIIALLLLQYAAKVDVLSWVINQWSSLLLYVCSHFTIGTFWSIFKWFRLVRTSLKEYRSRKTRFLTEYNPDSAETGIIPPQLKTKWEKEITNLTGYGKSKKLEYPPNIKDHKNEVVTWIVYWPISMICSILGDFTSWLSGKIYSFIKEIYNLISDLVFAELEKDLGKDNKEG